MIQTIRFGKGCSMSLQAVSRLGKGGISPAPALRVRLDRNGFRPIHFECRSFSSTTTGSGLRATFRGQQLTLPSRPSSILRVTRQFSTPQSPLQPSPTPPEDPQEDENGELSESPYTIPNALTLARIIACPFLGYQIVQGDYVMATSLLFACGVSDWLDGYLARHWGGKSVLGSILDPAADKALMTTLVITLAWAGLLPGKDFTFMLRITLLTAVPLAILILGRDVALSLSAFYFRYISLPPPRTISRYFNPSIPSAEVKPTQISKINTALQLVLMGVTTVSPLISYPLGGPLECLQWIVAGTTIWSGLSYVGKAGVRILPRRGKKVQ